MTPTETVAAMLRAYPTLFKTRFDALHWLVSAGASEWDHQNSSIFNEDAVVRYGRVGYDEEEATEGRSEASAINARLKTRKANWDLRFTIENADLIAQDTQSGFSEVILRGNMDRLLDMPVNVDPEWKAALIELCQKIVNWEYPVGYMSVMTGSRYSIGEKYADDLVCAKKQAKEFLVRAKGGEDEKAALIREKLAADLNKLRERAAAHGLTIDDLC